MGTTIRVSEETKALLERLKREGETWDEFLVRLVTDEKSMETGVWSDEDAERAKEAIRESRENWR